MIKVSLKINLMNEQNDRLVQENEQLRKEIANLNGRIKGFEADCRGDVQIIEELRAQKASLEATIASKPETLSCCLLGHPVDGKPVLSPDQAKAMLKDLMSCVSGGLKNRNAVIRAVLALTGLGLQQAEDLVEYVCP